MDDAPGPSVGLVGVSEDSVSNLATTYMGRVWGCVTRAEIVGVCDGNVGAVSYRVAVPSSGGMFPAGEGGPLSCQRVVARHDGCMGTTRWSVSATSRQ